MKAPRGYALGRVLSPGPLVFVAEATGPGGGACVVKGAAMARGVEAVAREAGILHALGEAGVEGVPRLLAVEEGALAMSRIDLPPLASLGVVPAEGVARAFARLAAIHDARDARGPLDVVHGDLAPGNVYLAPDGARAAIADFGLARWRDDGAVREGDDGAVRGTLRYAAPEVARSEPATPRSDDFALAASILHVATGVPLRDAPSLAALVARAAEEPLDAAHPWRTRAYALFPRAIADALLACLAFDPRDRPPTTPRPVLQPRA